MNLHVNYYETKIKQIGIKNYELNIIKMNNKSNHIKIY